jgi:cytochrome P450
MADQQVRDELMTLLVAGHETLSNALPFTWYLLSQPGR